MKKMLLRHVMAVDGKFCKKEFPVLFVCLSEYLGDRLAVVMMDPFDEDARKEFQVSEENPYVRVSLGNLRLFPDDFNKIFKS